MKDNLGKKTVGGAFWLFMERICAQLVSFSVSMILARLLLPEEYGIVAIVTVFITIFNVFVTGGFSTSLVQKKDADDLDFSSVLYFGLFMAVIAYAVLYLAAPFLNKYYNYDQLTTVLRVMGLQVIIASVKSVYNAILTKKMQFKKFFWATFIGTVISAVVSIIMAYNGFGVWALVAQYLLNSIMDTVILGLVIAWFPKFRVSFKRLKGLISYGWKVLVSSLIDAIYNNIRSLIIGVKYSAADLAYYNRGKHFPDLIMNNINQAISNAVFPALSQKQDKREEVKYITRMAIKLSSYMVMPLMFGLAVIAQPLVKMLLTDKWLPCVPFLRILCFNAALMPLQSANVQAILAIGRSDINIKLNMLKKGIGLLIICISSQISVIAMAYAGMITGVLCLIINASPNKKLFDYSLKEQVLDIVPYVAMSFIMGISVWFIQYLPIIPIIQIALQVSIGIVVYIFISIIFKVECYYKLVALLKGYIKKK
ncbi:MAG: lipopolysaccharide biosynthesis protein [Firmicutes bacterium]|nr:lipopolysaccharide biosynthesis protein [Bacillota bacterium]